MPTLIEKYKKGTLKVDEFVTHNFTLAEINHGFEVMEKGEAIRSVVTLW